MSFEEEPICLRDSCYSRLLIGSLQCEPRKGSTGDDAVRLSV